MARYTIDVYTLLKDNNFKVFNFDYDFYTDDPNIKQAFETKFIDRYMFNEIGFETVSRFKHYLKERLNSIAPYYKQLYETELKSKDIEFLLNKDLKETFIREIEVEKNATNDTTMSNTNDTTSTSTENTNNNVTTSLNESDKNNTTSSSTETINNNTTSSSNENSNNSLTSNTIENNDTTGNETKSDNLVSDFKESNLDNGNADLSLNQGYLTNVNNKHDVTTSTSNNTLNENKENSTTSSITSEKENSSTGTVEESKENSTTSSLTSEKENTTTSSMQDEKTSNLSTKLKSTGVNNTINNENENQTETTTLISRGNIGVTSSAELLKQWREVLINIDNLIIEECRDLFMHIY